MGIRNAKVFPLPVTAYIDSMKIMIFWFYAYFNYDIFVRHE